MASINFNTTNQTFRQLLGNGLNYEVPMFQRDYSWTADEWEDLWMDIEAMYEPDGEDAHYMGYLVLKSGDQKPVIRSLPAKTGWLDKSSHCGGSISEKDRSGVPLSLSLTFSASPKSRVGIEDFIDGTSRLAS